MRLRISTGSETGLSGDRRLKLIQAYVLEANRLDDRLHQIPMWIETDGIPPPTPDELTLIRTKNLEEQHHTQVDINTRLDAEQAACDK